MPKAKSSDFYVYLHRRASDGAVFYVGKGCGDRATDMADRSEFWKRVVNKYGRYIEIVASGLQEWYAHELERDLIALYGRRDLGDGPLCNMTDGGDGASGQVMSQEARDKVSAAQMGNSTWKGRKHTEETKAKMRKPKADSTNMRKPKSEAMRAKLSASKGIPVLCSNGMSFQSSKLAALWLRENGKPKAADSAISMAAKGKLKTAYGLKWSYVVKS